MIKSLDLRRGETFRRLSAYLTALVLALASMTPLILSGLASADLLDERELQSTVATPGATTDLTWIFDTTANAANVNQIEIEFCDTPLDACTVVNTPTIAGSPAATLTGFSDNTVTSTTRVNGDNGGSNNQVDIVLTTPGSGASLDEATVSLAPTDITNNAAANTSY